MARWKIESVGSEPRKWKNNHGGENISYRIKVVADSPQPPKNQESYSGVELVQKPETKAPAAGDAIDGDVTVRKYQTKDGEDREDLRFKKEYANKGGGGGGRGWQPRIDDDPVVYAGKQAAIAAQTSIERATELVVACMADEKYRDKLGEDLPGLVLTIAGQYEEHVQERAKAAGKRVREAKGE